MSNVKIEGLNCTGDETHIAACHFNGWGHIQCHHGNGVGVICGKILFFYFICNSNMTSFFRFVDKRTIYRCHNLIRTCARECD